MSDTAPAECNSNSRTNLIEVQHVGVTAKLQSPLKDLLLNYSSSTENENGEYRSQQPTRNSSTKYNKFNNEEALGTTTSDTTTTDSSKILYEMKAIPNQQMKKKDKKLTLTPSKIEFQLYTRNSRKTKKKPKHAKTKETKRQLFEDKAKKAKTKEEKNKTPSLFQRMRLSFGEMRRNSSAAQNQPPPTPMDQIFDNLPEPPTVQPQEIRIGIYPFDHGNAEYLKTHDCPPHIHSLALAQRTTDYATRFWAEVFGSLHIGVAFIVCFILQCYRFILYSVINTLLVGLLHMTSDYLLKPLLAVAFNGYLQPPMIFCFNVLASLRDILEPIAETLNNFMKPLATVGRSVRLVHATYNKKNITRNV
ncbi:uncharacterized protein [Musca autumnalis]|uniref:uncharacterized protein n=1 Tax=Musca autumnalis TaxID=221902 RepID=UPI003CF1075D